MSEKFTLYDDSKYENHATDKLPLASKNMSKKEELKHKYVREQSERVEIPDWEEVEFGFDEGWNAAAKEIITQLRQTLSLMSNVHPSIQKHIIDVVESNIMEE